MNVLRPSQNSAFMVISMPTDYPVQIDTARPITRRIRFVVRPVFAGDHVLRIPRTRLQERMVEVCNAIKFFLMCSIRCCLPYRR